MSQKPKSFPVTESKVEDESQYVDMAPVFGDKIKLKVPKTNSEVSLKRKLKIGEETKYLIKNPKKPFVGDTDTLEAVVSHAKLPAELEGKITQEQYAALVDSTFESCEETYHQLKEQLNKPIKAIQEVTGDENVKFLPYLPERDKFITLTDMVVSDNKEMSKELESIRSLYTKYLDEDGNVKKDVPREDAYILELITDIKLRFFVCGNRILRLFEPAIKHVSDFYSTMKFSYYSQHLDEAPTDIKTFLQTRLHQYTNTKVPEAEHIPEVARQPA